MTKRTIPTQSGAVPKHTKAQPKCLNKFTFVPMPATTAYTIKLPQFEGPFDLLLFFIERDELDIHDIPISQVTEDFLAYVRERKQVDIDGASEFILVAATLCRIKAKMLIPRKPVDEEGNEIDPREELVQRLLEYKRYKSVLAELRTLEANRALKVKRGNLTRELRQLSTRALVDAELESVTLFKLLKAYERLLTNYEDRTTRKKIHQIINYSYTIADQQSFIFNRLRVGQKTSFAGIFGQLENRLHAVVTFLALLELLNLQRVRLIGGEGINSFWLEPGENYGLAEVGATPAAS